MVLFEVGLLDTWLETVKELFGIFDRGRSLSHKPEEAFVQNRRSEEVLVDSVETSSKPAVLSVNSEHRHCNTLQHTATHCNTLQHTAAYYNTLHHTATYYSTVQHAATQQFSRGGGGYSHQGVT